MRRIAALLAATLFAVGLVAGPALAYEFPSTNDDNRENGFPHVNLVAVTEDSVTLEFVNDTNSLTYFEYRIDGEQLIDGSPHPVIEGDFVYLGVEIDGRDTDGPITIEETFAAEAKVEIRLALGGERDWDFDWVTFEVADPSEEGPESSTPGFDARPAFVQACDDLTGTDYKNRGQCVSAARAAR
jgi:hypothetical protein